MKTHYDELVRVLTEGHPEVETGKMMSSPGLLFGGKVFAFFWKDRMVFKLGKAFSPDEAGLEDWSYLQPFKSKGPMKAWYVVPNPAQWPRLAEEALAYIKDEVR